MTTKTRPRSAQTTADALPIRAIDHIEFRVGNAYQTASFYQNVFGFHPLAYAGPETGLRDRCSYALAQGSVVFVFTAGLTPDSPIVQHVARHGDGVRDIALRVDDVDAAFQHTTGKGARPLLEPTTVRGEKGAIRRATIAVYGDTVHSFINRDGYAGAFYPLYHRRPSTKNVAQAPSPASTGIEAIDHVVANVELGQMERWASFYRDTMGFSQLVHFSDHEISTEYTALMSKVMQDGSGRIKFPINEPAPGKRKSQIDEYLEFYGGPGVQHIALHTNDILRTVRELGNRGVQFLKVPDSYYAALKDRLGPIREDFEAVRALNILADRDDEGYLLQIFTKPVQDRPTLFFEIIQRRGATGFGVGNFKALFEAVEAEQRRRGNL